MPESFTVCVTSTGEHRARPDGRRITYVRSGGELSSGLVEFERWHDIVGVVPDFPVPGPFDDESEGQLYHAVATGDLYPAHLNVRVRAGNPAALAAPLRDLSASIDPDLPVLDVSTADIAFTQAQGMMRLIGARSAFARRWAPIATGSCSASSRVCSRSWVLAPCSA